MNAEELQACRKRMIQQIKDEARRDALLEAAKVTKSEYDKSGCSAWLFCNVLLGKLHDMTKATKKGGE